MARKAMVKTFSSTGAKAAMANLPWRRASPMQGHQVMQNR